MTKKERGKLVKINMLLKLVSNIFFFFDNETEFRLQNEVGYFSQGQLFPLFRKSIII